MYRVFIVFLFVSNLIFSQEKLNQWNVSYGYGSIIQHKSGMRHLVSEHPILYKLSWSKTSDTLTAWKKRFNYPDIGITLTHQKFKTKILGNVTGISYFTNHYLLNRNSRHQFNFEIGFGLAYVDNPMDFETNSQNNALSSSFAFSQYFKIQYVYPNLFKEFGLQTGISFTHFSNASFKSPNNGINSIFLHAGIQYFSKNIKITYPKKLKTNKLVSKEPIQLNVNLSYGLHEVYAGLGTKSVIVVSPFGSKKIKKFGSIKSGLDFIYSNSAKQYAEFVVIAEYTSEKKDFKQLGFTFGFEQLFNKVSIDAQAGIYIYNPLKFYPIFYEKFGVKYHLNTKYALGLGLKVHKFKANFATLDIQYKIL